MRLADTMVAWGLLGDFTRLSQVERLKTEGRDYGGKRRRTHTKYPRTPITQKRNTFWEEWATKNFTLHERSRRM